METGFEVHIEYFLYVIFLMGGLRDRDSFSTRNIVIYILLSGILELSTIYV